MARIEVHTEPSLGHLPEDDRLRGVLAGALSKVGVAGERLPVAAHWPASFFGLTGIPGFEDASEDVQHAVLVELARLTLEEAWFIEKCGLTYMAQMALLAGTTEERQLYNLFSADEATHLQLVDRLLAERPTSPNAFHELLAEVIDCGDRGTLVFVIQVVLEGWGLTHYRNLADGATTPQVHDALHRILRDEARHHGAGNVLLEQASPDVALCADFMERFLAMVQAGPVMVLEVCAAHGVAVSAEELEADKHVASRMALLRGLMRKPGGEAVLAELDARGVFGEAR